MNSYLSFKEGLGTLQVEMNKGRPPMVSRDTSIISRVKSRSLEATANNHSSTQEAPPQTTQPIDLKGTLGWRHLLVAAARAA